MAHLPQQEEGHEKEYAGRNGKQQDNWCRRRMGMATSNIAREG
jgi:hypothetical protein